MANRTSFGLNGDGVPYGTQSNTDRWVESGDISLPTGRPMANGSRQCLMIAAQAFVRGRGGIRSVYMIMDDDKETRDIVVNSANGAAGTGVLNFTSTWLVQGGTTTFRIRMSGPSYFGTSNTGVAQDYYGDRYKGLAGQYLWAQGPTAPGLVVNPGTSNGTAQVTITESSDDGGAPISGYRLQWATNTAFTANTGVAEYQDGKYTISGLNIGVRYYFRVAAMNAVTDAARTYGAWSKTDDAVIPGPPSAVRNLSATPLVSELDAVVLQWGAPTDLGGGITGYDIWDGTGTSKLLLRTYGTGTSAKLSGLTKNASYAFVVRARNAWIDAVDARNAAASNTVAYTNWSSSSEAQNLTTSVSNATPGRIVLTWQPPASVGQGITKYEIYNSTGALVATVPSTQTTYNVEGLTPGIYYAFYILAYTARAAAAGTAGNKSVTVGTFPLGQPNKPTALAVASSATVASRLVLTWNVAGGYTGFNVYEIVNGSAVLVGTPAIPRLVLDRVTPATHTYVVATRNGVTDRTTPPTESPRSDPASGTPGRTSSIDATPFQVPNITNNTYNGTYVINSVAPKTVTFTLDAPDQAQTAVPAGVGLLTDSTNAALSGPHTITAVTPTTFSFAQTGADIPSNTAVPAIPVANSTNATFNGTFTVTAVDNTNLLVSYANTGTNVSTVAASGTITNRSNTVYNGTNLLITSLPSPNQFTYAKTNANLTETVASGSAVDVTNRDYYNATPDGRGSVVVLTAPTYNKLTYQTASALTQATTAIGNPYGVAYRATSKSVLTIKYRSGWAG